MSRSIWKGPFLAPCFFRESYKNKNKISIYARNSVISPRFVGQTFEIHNGLNFVSVYITEQMVGHKFGEFSFTKKKPIHKIKKKV